MAVVKPFRAAPLRRARAGPLDALVAPPYDVISAERARASYLAREPVQRRPPDAARRRGGGRPRSGATGAATACSSTTTSRRSGGSRRTTSGPTASPGRATGSSRALRLEPYESARRPAARAHARRPEGGPPAAAARDAHAARAALPPLRRAAPSSGPSGEPDARGRGRDGVRSRLWRADGDRRPRSPTRAAPDRRRPPPLRDGARLPRGGRHDGERVACWSCSSPTSRGPDDLPDAPASREPGERCSASGRRTRGGARPGRGAARDRAAAVVYRDGGAELVVDGEPGELDAALVERLGARGRHATRRLATRRSPRSTAARRRRRSSLRPPTDRAGLRASPQRGETMPQKSTYFYPEARSPASLFHPAVTDWLAALPRGGRGRARRARASCRPAPSASRSSATARAATRRPRSTRRPRRRSSRGSTRPASDFTLVSEELGDPRGDGAAARSSLDPIDGSLNAKRGHPVLLALGRGRRRARRWTTSLFGYVYDFGTRRGVDGRARRGRAA